MIRPANDHADLQFLINRALDVQREEHTVHDAPHDAPRVVVRDVGNGRAPRDAAGLLVAAALIVLIEANHTPGDAARLVIEGVNRGLRATSERVNDLIAALAAQKEPTK